MIVLIADGLGLAKQTAKTDAVVGGKRLENMGHLGHGVFIQLVSIQC